MNGQWKLVIVLVCVLVVVSIFAVLTFVENNDLYKQIKDQERLELQIKSRDVKIEKLENPEPTTTEAESLDTENITDKELIEFLVSYKDAQKTYIKTLQKVCRTNGVSYPTFIYAELEEELK